MIQWMRRGDAPRHGLFKDDHRLGWRLLEDLHSLDPTAELFFHRLLGKWFLYRRRWLGATPSGDSFAKQCVIQGPDGEYREPGPWLIPWLKTQELTALGGTHDRDRAGRLWIERIEREEREREEAQERERQKISHHMAEDYAFALSGRNSGVHVPKEKPRAGVKRIRDGNPKGHRAANKRGLRHAQR